MSGYPAVPELDRVIALADPTVDDYVSAASAYVLDGRKLPSRGTAASHSAKAAQTALSKVLGKVLKNELQERHRSFIATELGAAAFSPPKGRPPGLDPATALTHS